MEILTHEGAGVDDWWTEPERRRVTRLCARITGDPVAAEDLAQETLLEAWRIRERLVDPSGSGPWLDAIARNVCRRWRVRHGRLRSREVATTSSFPPEPGHDEVADLLEREELVELLDRALGLLPPETRAALVSRYVDELATTEIARRLRLTPEAVSMRLTRGRARLRALLETELSDDPLARVWVNRHGVAWRTVRVACVTCGAATSSMRRDHDAGVIEARCERCHRDSLASSWSLDNPTLGPHLRAVSRPTAVVARMLDWAADWWPAAIATGRGSCTRCGRDVRVLPYTRAEDADAQTRRGWQASCPACGEALSSSFLGLALATAEARALRARRPRAHAVPTRTTEHGGRPALVVGLYDDASGDRVDVLFDDATARPLGVVASV